MNVFEYPHIEEAIENVRNDLKYKKRSAVIATMGIGKSAIATRIILDYADNNIIFGAPKKIILDQIKNHLQNMGYDFKNIQFYTYGKLHYMIKNGTLPNFDLLVCDEFHAISNKKQYESIKKLFTYDDNRRYLGLSATPILQWEYENIYVEKEKKTKKRVNMAEVLFDNNISYVYSLDQALIDGVFPYPIYHEFYILDNKDSRKTALEILKQRKVKNITEYKIDSLANYLEKNASLVPILKKYIDKKNTKIMYYCRDLNDLIKTETLLKEIFPTIPVYKTACKLNKKENERNIEQFRNMDFPNGNSKILLSIRQVTEGFHTDGKMQIVFGNKTNAYRDFVQKFGRGFSLGNNTPVEIIDLGGNLTRISSLDFLKFKERLEVSRKRYPSSSKKVKIQYSGNLVDLNELIDKMTQNIFISKKEKTDIYYNEIISNFGELKNPEERFKDGTYLKDWYKEMLYIATRELHLLKENPSYQMSKENMYIIESLAYIDNFLEKKKAETEEKRREEYYKKAVSCRDYVPKNDLYRFYDGTYMSNWYQSQKRKAKRILEKIEQKEDYKINENQFELLQWLNMLNTDLKILWTDKLLGFQRREQQSDKYKRWQEFSSVVSIDSTLLKNKKECEALEEFRLLDEFYHGVESRTNAASSIKFPYANIEMDNIKKHLVLEKHK